MGEDEEYSWIIMSVANITAEIDDYVGSSCFEFEGTIARPVMEILRYTGISYDKSIRQRCIYRTMNRNHIISITKTSLDE